MTTADLLALLRRHYIKPSQPLPGGVFLAEVGVNGSWGSGSRCDAIYVGFTSTSGRRLVGHELKISRADWLNELNKPGKSDQWADQCHQWWLVVSDPTIVRDGELPPGWGLMSPGKSKTKMAVHVKAEMRDITPSWNAVRSIIARQDTLRAQEISKGIAAAAEKARVDVERRAAELARRLAAVEEALGAPIDWNTSGTARYRHISLDAIREIGQAAKAYGGVQNAVDALTRGFGSPIRYTREAVDHLEKALDGVRSALTSPAPKEDL